MSGFGIDEQFEAGMKFENDTMWRTESFMHQLSLNGSLVLSANHDALWLSYLATIMNSNVVHWEHLSNILRMLPASLARQALWRASWFWWRTTMSYHKQSIKMLSEIGGLETALHIEWMETQANDLALKAWQIENLAWCRSDDDQEKIEVIEALPQAKRKRLPALPRVKSKE